jgi:hypothetical protein
LPSLPCCLAACASLAPIGRAFLPTEKQKRAGHEIEAQGQPLAARQPQVLAALGGGWWRGERCAHGEVFVQMVRWNRRQKRAANGSAGEEPQKQRNKFMRWQPLPRFGTAPGRPSRACCLAYFPDDLPRLRPGNNGIGRLFIFLFFFFTMAVWAVHHSQASRGSIPTATPKAAWGRTGGA